MLPVVNYHLRDDLQTLIVCLYNHQDAPETQLTTETLHNYIVDCEWQLEQGLPVRRIPFYITASMTDATRAMEDMRMHLQELRKMQKRIEENNSISSPGDQGDGKGIPRGVITDPGRSEVSSPNISGKKKNTPYHLWKSTGRLYKPD